MSKLEYLQSMPVAAVVKKDTIAAHHIVSGGTFHAGIAVVINLMAVLGFVLRVVVVQTHRNPSVLIAKILKKG
jgi:hypothetical protein